MKNAPKLLHFGDACYPYIIINHLLNIKTKTPFQLGTFPFDSNVNILDNKDFDGIYALENLRYDNKELAISKVQNKAYAHTSTNVHNIKYDVWMNHDFEIENQQVLNYDFILESGKEKFNNFIEFLKEDLVIINFTDNLSQDFNKLPNVLESKYNAVNFRVLIFTNNKEELNYTLNPKIQLIRLDNDYQSEWDKPQQFRIELFREIWEKFIYAVEQFINYKYPKFEDVISKETFK